MRKKTQKAEFTLKDGSRLVVDSGLVSRYRPAQHVKPEGLLRSAVRKLWPFSKKFDPKKTTEQGSGAAAPSIYEWELFAERIDRMQQIRESRRLIQDDPRARRSTLKLAKEATRKGATITVDLKASPSKRMAQRAQKVADELIRTLNPQPVNGMQSSGKLRSWAWMLVVEGDLFVQPILSGNTLVDAKRMPAASMERLTNDADEFIDPAKAFGQLDTANLQEQVTWPEALMYHARWNHIDGDRYGQPELSVLRRMNKMLELSENAQGVRRMVRAPQRILWNVGTEKNPGDEAAIQQFKDINGFVEGKRDIWDPTNIALDYFANGLGSADPIEGDATVHEIDDIKYLQNIYTAGMPTPGYLYGLDCNSLNRDVMDALRAEYLKEVQDLADELAMLVAWLFETALKLMGIHPDWIVYTVQLSDNSSEDPSAVVDRISKMKDSNLISHKLAVQMASQFHNANPDDEFKAIQQEDTDRRAKDAEFNVSPSNGHLPQSKNGQTNGKAKTVHA
jgi:hypothetical protein